MSKTGTIFLCIIFTFLIFRSNAKAQHILKDQPYKFGDFMIVSPDTMNMDYIIKNKPSTKRISRGDTLYEDNKYIILGNEDNLLNYDKYGIFKKYAMPYNFSSFKATVYKGKLAPPDFKTDTAAWLFRTQIRNQCKKNGINFAGHFTLVMWGCGSDCKAMAIVDRINGKIYYSNVLTLDESVFFTLEFNRNSNLVIMNDWLMKEHKGYIFCSRNWEIINVKWGNNKFRLLSAIKLNDHPANP